MAQEILNISRASRLIMLGGSAGSLELVLDILRSLPPLKNAALCLVVHRNATYESALTRLVQANTDMPVREVDDKMPIDAGALYIAPPNYHLLCERDAAWSLDASEKVNHSRPSIDVAFESAADAYGPGLMCVLLSGANADGAAGLVAAKVAGATVAVHDPDEAPVKTMPMAGLRAVPEALVCSAQMLPLMIARFAAAGR